MACCGGKNKQGGPVKIHVGCGGNKLDGWNNTDFDVVDIRNPLPWGDGIADIIFAEHVVEHISCAETLRFFDECRRVLKKDGVLRICVPVARITLDRDHLRDLILGHGHMQVMSYEVLHTLFIAAGFTIDAVTDRKEMDSHWKAIGKDKDDIETLRMEAIKT
jgi:predicted SAM-dependent methyltransferase